MGRRGRGGWVLAAVLACGPGAPPEHKTTSDGTVRGESTGGGQATDGGQATSGAPCEPGPEAPMEDGPCFGRAPVDCGKPLPEGTAGRCELKRAKRFSACAASCEEGVPEQVCVWFQSFGETGCDCLWWWRVGEDGIHVLDPDEGATCFYFPVDWNHCDLEQAWCACFDVSAECL